MVAIKWWSMLIAMCSLKKSLTQDGRPGRYIGKQVALPVEPARRRSCRREILTALPKEGELHYIGRSTGAIPTVIKRAMNIRDGSYCLPDRECNIFYCDRLSAASQYQVSRNRS